MTQPDGYAFGSFEFGLSSEQEQRARRLYEEAVVIDLLYWGPVAYRSFDDKMEQELRRRYDVHRNAFQAVFEAQFMGGRMAVDGQYPEYEAAWNASGLTGGHFPLMVGSEPYLIASASHLARLSSRLPWIRAVRRTQDFLDAKRDRQLALFGLCQPMHPIGRNLALLEQSYDLGLRVLMLTYNDQDAVGSGCTDRTDSGLSNFGKQVVKACNDLGIIVDTAHCGRQTTLDACAFSEGPVLATHTAAEAVFRHDRGKSDEELQAIAGTGGVVGVVTVPFFIGPVAGADMNTWLDHVDYIAGLIGWQHVGIGTDWPMAGPKWTMERLAETAHESGFRDEDHGTGDITSNLVGFDDYRDLPNMARGLVARGYTDEQILGILGGNALRAFRQGIG